MSGRFSHGVIMSGRQKIDGGDSHDVMMSGRQKIDGGTVTDCCNSQTLCSSDLSLLNDPIDAVFQMSWTH